MYDQLIKKVQEEDFLTVVCVGDAFTSQAMVKPSWTDWLQRALWENGDVQKTWRRQLFNTGIEKATPRHVATYIRSYVTQCKPDVVIVSFGATPILPHYDEPTFLAEFDSMVDALQRADIPVVLWSPYPLSGGIARDASIAVTTIFQQKAEQLGWQFVDIYHEFDQYEIAKMFPYTVLPPYNQFTMEAGANDFIHIGPEGQYVIAKKIAQEVFHLGLPLETQGSYVVPALDGLRRWS